MAISPVTAKLGTSSDVNNYIVLLEMNKSQLLLGRGNFNCNKVNTKVLGIDYSKKY